MASPVISISNPKRLFKDDYNALRGTALYEQMFRNRCRVEVKGGLNDAKDVARTDITDWLKANCGTFYFIDDGCAWVYIEGDADVVNFKMRFHDQEVAIPEPPPPPKPKPAAAPTRPSTTISKQKHKDWAKMFEGVNKSRGYFGDGYESYAKDHGIDEELVSQILSHMNNKG